MKNIKKFARDFTMPILAGTAVGLFVAYILGFIYWPDLLVKAVTAFAISFVMVFLLQIFLKARKRSNN